MGKQLIQRLMVIRVSDTNHVWSIRVVWLDESLMKVVCIAAYTIRSPRTPTSTRPYVYSYNPLHT